MKTSFNKQFRIIKVFLKKKFNNRKIIKKDAKINYFKKRIIILMYKIVIIEIQKLL